ncbi:MAG: cation:proton antiporter, partial [Luteococcus japonicus]
MPTPDGLREVGDIGVTLLLFSVGLKLDLRLLARREVGVTALVHMVVAVCSLALLLFVGSLMPWGPLSGAAMPQVLLLSFALSFSSTVLVVKALEEAGRSGSFHGRIAVGILVVQDVVAVVFMVVAEGQLPSWWAILLLLLFPARRLLTRLVEECHHPEVQMLAGLALSLGLGYLLFDAVGIKGDLGALVIGVLLRESSAADALARRLDPLKDLLLVAFFMAIGLSGVPNVDHLLLALGLLLVLPVKGWGFARLLRRAGVDRRVMGRAGLSLANYSEFGLIVAAVAVDHGWLSEDWLVGMAVVVACGFIVSSAVQRSPR